MRRLGRPGWAKPGHVPSARDSRIRRLGAEVFATAITTTATDYRYATAQVEEPARLEPHELDPDVAQRCVDLTADRTFQPSPTDKRQLSVMASFAFASQQK